MAESSTTHESNCGCVGLLRGNAAASSDGEDIINCHRSSDHGVFVGWSNVNGHAAESEADSKSNPDSWDTKGKTMQYL